MRKITLFIAMSLDGYIADAYGNVDWLAGQDSAETANDTASYDEFIKGIDTVIMGYKTYRQLAEEISPDVWPYSELQSYVITHRDLSGQKHEGNNIIFTDAEPGDLLRKLRQQEGEEIWICGGASIVNQLLKQDMIDRFYISVIPTILGSGIRLFDTLETEKKLKLTGTKSYNGIVDLIYERRETM